MRQDGATDPPSGLGAVVTPWSSVPARARAALVRLAGMAARRLDRGATAGVRERLIERMRALAAGEIHSSGEVSASVRYRSRMSDIAELMRDPRHTLPLRHGPHLDLAVLIQADAGIGPGAVVTVRDNNDALVLRAVGPPPSEKVLTFGGVRHPEAVGLMDAVAGRAFFLVDADKGQLVLVVPPSRGHLVARVDGPSSLFRMQAAFLHRTSPSAQDGIRAHRENTGAGEGGEDV
jgi:hypothetical protein